MPFGIEHNNFNLIKDVFAFYSKIDEAIIFGSRALGTEREGSDVDIAIKGNNLKIDDILALKNQLLELPLAYDYDIIIYENIKNIELTEHIDKNGISFYEKGVLPSEWKTYKLSEVVEIKYGKDHKHLADGEIPLYGSGGIMRYVDTPLYEQESILIPRKGTLSNLFYLNKPFWSVDTMFYTKIKSGNNGKYLYYLLKSMDLASMNVGSAVPSLTTEVLNKVEINVPEEPTQIEIAQILTSLDDKIELNLQMNQTLETMAQAIFKEWFVDFKFPNFDGVLVDGLPKSWRNGKIIEKFEVTDYVANGSFASLAENEQYKREPDYAVLIRLTDYNRGHEGEFVYLNKHSYSFLNKSKLFGDEIIIANVGANAGDVFRAPFLNRPMSLGPNAIMIKNNIASNYLYSYLVSAVGQHSLKSIIAGSAQPKFNKTDFRNLELIFPDKITLSLFNDIYKTINEKTLSNKSQIQTITNTRDNLLPKLMSGKIEVKN